MTDNNKPEIYLCVSKDGLTGSFQLSIEDDDGGFRIAGPKFNGSSSYVIRHKLSAYDAREIGSYLAVLTEPSVQHD